MRELFLDVLHRNTPSIDAVPLWDELERAYGSSGRYYHTLIHLDAVVNTLLACKSLFEQWDTVILAVAYHDAVYNPLKSDNEARSAAMASDRLSSIGYAVHEVERCVKLILATKDHAPGDGETNLFTDADLCILGASPEAYVMYTEQVRREYAVYPDLIYRSGRRKVLKHFLQMPAIFKTRQFTDLYEAQARKNMQGELDLL